MTRTIEPGQVYLGDCFSLMQHLDEESVDLILTDPPYGMSFRSNRTEQKKIGIQNDGKDEYAALVRMIAKRSVQHLIPGGLLVMFCAGGAHPGRLLDALQQVESVPGLDVENFLIWDKGYIGMGAHQGYRPMWEGILIAKSSGAPRYYSGRKDQGDILRFTRARQEEDGHPTPKPGDLLAALIVENCRPGGLVLDPFCGEGPVLVAAARTGRRYIGMEIEPTWHGRAQLALQAVDSQPMIPGLIPQPKQEQLL